MKTCGYVPGFSGYTTDCGHYTIKRPSLRCPKCNRKTYERKKGQEDATGVDRTSDGPTR
jgi:hypothetical protein